MLAKLGAVEGSDDWPLSCMSPDSDAAGCVGPDNSERGILMSIHLPSKIRSVASVKKREVIHPTRLLFTRLPLVMMRIWKISTFIRSNIVVPRSAGRKELKRTRRPEAGRENSLLTARWLAWVLSPVPVDSRPGCTFDRTANRLAKSGLANICWVTAHGTSQSADAAIKHSIRRANDAQRG